TGSSHAAIAAATTAGGVGKSGSPAPNPMTSSPAARSAFAFASTASVADSVIAAMRREMRTRSETRGAGLPSILACRCAGAARDSSGDAGAGRACSGGDGLGARIPGAQIGETGIVREDLDDGERETEAALHGPHVVLLVPSHQRHRDAGLTG